MARSLNKVTLIGNLTRDPELRYTPAGAAVCAFGLATNRQWTTESGDKKEDAEFHRIVAWNKLAELCAQLLAKGRKVYVEGRLQTRRWTGRDGVERITTEIVISDMIILDSKYSSVQEKGQDFDIPEEEIEPEQGGNGDLQKTKGSEKLSVSKGKTAVNAKETKSAEKSDDGKKSSEEGDSDDDIPF